jgi:acetyltransferase-like isoleucine patch superfamily enzyme/acyl carrier protein
MIAGFVARRCADLRRTLLAHNNTTGRRAHEPLKACNRVGKHPILIGQPYVVNDGHIQIGNRFRLSSLPVRTHLVTERSGRIVIGDDVNIGHGSGLAAHASITIGDGTRLGAFVLVMDTDFHVPGDSEAYVPRSPIAIGRNVHVGNHVTILRGSNVGDEAFVMDGSVVSGNVDGGAHVSGVPARLLHAGSDESDASMVSVGAGVAFIAMKTFRLPNPPDLRTSRDDIAGWDSLGALNFMLALEDAFSLVLGEDDMTRAHTLADVERVIREIRSRQKDLNFPEGNAS